MEIGIKLKDLETLSSFIESGEFVNAMNDSGCSFSAMALALQTLIDKIEDIREKLLSEEN